MRLENTGNSRQPRPTGLTRLGWLQLAVVYAGVVAVVLVVGITFRGEWYDLYVSRVAIRDFENVYGFKTGTVTVHAGNLSYERWGIVSVAADGEFAALGVRDGDLPFRLGGHSTSAIVLYEALEDASTGRASWFEVINAADAARPVPRTINVPPRRPR